MKDTLFIAAEAGAVFASGMKEKPVRVNAFARIKDQDGEPVTGLTQSDFQVIHLEKLTEIESPNLTISEIKKESLVLPGTYSISFTVQLIKLGQYAFAIKVKKATKANALTVSKILSGQTLISVVKLE